MAFEYLFTSLPALPYDPGGNVGLDPARFARMCAEEGGVATRLTHAILMAFDLKAMEGARFGTGFSETAIYAEKELEEKARFPEWLLKALVSEEGGYAYAFDRVWEAYYRELFDLAARHSSRFLRSWVSWEVGLRNSVARLRAQRAGLEGTALAIEGISDQHPSIYRPVLDSLVSLMDGGFNSWREMDRSMNALRLFKARELAPQYTFNMDELLSYAVQFVILRGSPYLSH